MSQDKDTNETRHDSASRTDTGPVRTGTSLLTDEEWTAVSPTPAQAVSQETAATVKLNSLVDGDVDRATGQTQTGNGQGKHRPVDRRFSGIHQPNLELDDSLKERLESVEEKSSEKEKASETQKEKDKAKKKEEESEETSGSQDSSDEVKVKEKKGPKKKRATRSEEKQKAETKETKRKKGEEPTQNG
jgi:hypothetical protein